MQKENFDRARWVPIIIVATIVIAIYYAFGNLTEITAAIGEGFSVISPLLYGILFSYFLYIPHRFIEKLLKKVKIKKFTLISRHARGITTVVVFILLIVIIGLVVAYLVPVIADSIVSFATDLPRYAQTAAAEINRLLRGSPFEDLNIDDLLRENVSTIINTIISSPGVESAARGVVSFAGGVLNVVLGIVISLYILLYRNGIREYFTRLNNAVFRNEHRRERILQYFEQINKVLLTFIASKGVDSIINFAAATTIMLIFQVPYALLFGLIAGLLNFIPYIGSVISALLISVLALLTCELPIAIAVAISMFVFQQMDGNYIEPRIMNTSLKINPILVIMAVVIGGAIFDIAGMFLGVPIAVIIKQLLGEYMSVREAAVPEHTDTSGG